jgi:hypothetical protein
MKEWRVGWIREWKWWREWKGSCGEKEGNRVEDRARKAEGVLTKE